MSNILIDRLTPLGYFNVEDPILKGSQMLIERVMPSCMLFLPLHGGTIFDKKLLFIQELPKLEIFGNWVKNFLEANEGLTELWVCNEWRIVSLDHLK
nr:hypothetical protein [Chitinophagaceae bacterium]